MKNYLLSIVASILALTISQAQSYPVFNHYSTPGVSAPGDVFVPSMKGSPVSGVPQVAEWTRTAGPDESIVLTGHQLSRFSGAEEGKDTRFLVHASGGVQKQALIQRLEGDKAILTLDKSLPSWGMYLIWPGNDAGWGTPIAVNKTEAWWVQDKGAPGMSVSVYGRNLARGNVEGTGNSHVYLKSLSGGPSQWVTVTKVNPYKVDFTIPSSFPSGSYEVWVHNGHGGEYGWSDKLKLTVVSRSEHVLTKSWGTVYNVKNYGAQGNGYSDDRAAINKAVAAAGASGGVVYFPAGTYMVSGSLSLSSNSKWMGDKDAAGKPNSTIKLMPGGYSVLKGYAVNMNVFENLRFASSGQKVEAELVDIRKTSMMWWNNCEIDGRGANAARYQGDGTQHIYLRNTVFIGGVNQWGTVLYIDELRQIFIDGCTFKMTNDCGAAIINRGIKESSMTNSTVQDFNSATTDGSGWGKGRIWSSTGGGGSQYHQYFGGNKGIGLGTRISGTNRPDNNSGEILLWEANATTFQGSPIAATATTVTFSSTPSNKAPDGVAREISLFVYEGKGAGQYRRIIAQSGGYLTIDRPWGVVPDGTSKIGVGMLSHNVAIYKNSLDASGKPHIANDPYHTASAGVQPYGGCFDFVIDGNTMTGLRRGTTVFSHGPEHGNGITPNYFHLFTNNKMVNCRFGIYNGSLTLEEDGYAILGLLYRKNTVQQSVISAVQNDVKYASTPIFRAFAYEHNTFGGSPMGFQPGNMYHQDPSKDYGWDALDHQIFYRNRFSGSSSAIRVTPKIALRENTYQGFASIYKGSASASSTVLEAPYHVMEMEAAKEGSAVKAIFPVWNSGTFGFSWSAKSSASWLSLSSASGTLKGETETANIELTANPKGLSEGTHKATLSLTTQAGTKYYTILLKVGGSVSAPAPVAPTVSLTAPTANASFTAGAAINITASAADSDGSVSKVEFFNGTTRLGEDLTAPYAFTWNNVSAGSYTLTAKATDNSGKTATSQVVSIAVNNPAPTPVAPTVSMTTPAANTSFTAPAAITLTANAADSDGTISKVEFFNGSTKLGEDVTAPYAFTWDNVSAGSYSITAKATDNSGLTATSKEVVITVTNPAPAPEAPTVALTGPATVSYIAPATVNITANASDDDGTITKVEFFNGNNKLGEDLSAPYAFTWNGVAAGTYNIKAKATDNSGLSAFSKTVSITVSTPAPAPVAPSVTITSPATNSGFKAPASVSITATAADSDGSVSKVEFFNGTTKLGEDLAAPYAFVWNNVSAGSYTLTAKATDNSGLSTTSASVKIAVSNPAPAPVAPTVSLSSPANNSNFTAPASITLTANASDVDGTISKVEFYNGNTKLGEDATAPYSFVWKNVAAGTYVVKAKATDNSGMSTTSQNVTLTVKNPPPPPVGPVVSITSPKANASFKVPASVTINANASDADGRISKVEFFNGNKKLGEDATAPYSFTWSNVTTGSFTLTVKATDNSGMTATSAGVKISVSNPAPVAPAVSLTSLNRGNLTAPANVTLTANASDKDGKVVKVEFFSGSEKIGEATANPYSITWNEVQVGTYIITAKATDNAGLTTTSKPMQLVIVKDVTVNSLTIYPNPFMEQATIEFDALEAGHVSLQVYNMQGALVSTLFEQQVEAKKTYKQVLNATNLPAGTYICRLTYDNGSFHKTTIQKKIIRVK